MLCVSCFVWLFFAVFLFQKNICLNKLVHAVWLPVSSSHLISVPPNWQRHATKKVRSFIPCHFIIFGERSDPPRNLRVPDFRVFSVPDLALADRAIYRARIKNSQKPPQNTRERLFDLSFIHILKRMWGLPVSKHGDLSFLLCFSKQCLVETLIESFEKNSSVTSISEESLYNAYEAKSVF